MSPFKSTRWIEYTQYCVKSHIYKYKNSKNLNDQDWQDITQDILLHIWQKRKKYKVTKFLKPWIKTIVSRLIINHMRNRCIIARNDNYKKRAYVLYPRPIFLIEKEEDLYGDFYSTYIYDIKDDTELYYDRKIEELKEILNAEDFRRIKDLFIDFNVKMSAKRLKIKPITLYNTIQRVKKEVKNAKNTPIAI